MSLETSEKAAANSISFLAVTRFKRLCSEHKDFMTEPAIVMQIIYDQMFDEIMPQRESWINRNGKSGGRGK